MLNLIPLSIFRIMDFFSNRKKDLCSLGVYYRRALLYVRECLLKRYLSGSNIKEIKIESTLILMFKRNGFLYFFLKVSGASRQKQ